MVWCTQFGTAEEETMGSICEDVDGNILFSGSTGGSFAANNAGGQDVFLGKFDTDGNQLWTLQFGTPQDDVNPKIASDCWGNVLMTGSTWGAFGRAGTIAPDVFVAKFSPVPEPSSLSLIIAGVLGLFSYAYRHRKPNGW